MSETVGIFRCENYDVEPLVGILKDAATAVGFNTGSIRGKTLLLKPNMLGAYPPEMGITSHPNFVEAAIILFKGLGAKVCVGDSANGIFEIDSVWERTGIRGVCKRHGVEEKVFEREGSQIVDGLLIARPVLEADVVVNLPRFKTHGLTVLTIAAKNLYGCVPGLQKTRYHQKATDRLEFAKLVVRIAEIAKPALNLVDGILAMEGNGPSAGRLVPLNAVVSGTNHHAVDTVCAKIICLDPKHVDTIEAAVSLGLWDPETKIAVAGKTPEDVRPATFDLPATFTKGMRDWWISLFVINRIWGGISIKPKVNEKKCQRCGLCVKACPVDAIITEKAASVHAELVEAQAVHPSTCSGQTLARAPHVLIKNCVQCYCCHEICPYQAIDLNESLGVRIGRFLGERRIRKLNGCK